MRHLDATLLGLKFFPLHQTIIHLYLMSCSTDVNTGSVKKRVYNMPNLFYKYVHYIHEMHVPASYALVI